MRPRILLLLALTLLTIAFMAFLVKNPAEKKISCANSPCSKQQEAPKPVETSGGGLEGESFHHLIVSTIK